MATNDNVKLVYQVERHRLDGGYFHDKIMVAECYKVDTAERIAGTVDNKDGYGTLEAAQRMGRCYQQLLDAGHKTYFEHSYSGQRHNFTITYQVYEVDPDGTTRYCAPSFDWPTNYQGAKWAMNLAERIGKRMERAWAKEQDRDPRDAREVVENSFRDFRAFLTALEKMGAMRVKTWRETSGSFPNSYLVKAEGPVAANMTEYTLVP
jgi:hypothetical protein